MNDLISKVYYFNYALIIIWVITEFISNIKQNKKNNNSEKKDMGSTLIMFGATFISFLGGLHFAFSKIGFMESLFPFTSIAGIIFIISGIILRYISIKILEKQFTYSVKIVEDHKLIISGVYKYIRHPSYSGYLLIFLGIGMSYCNWLSIICFFIPNLISIIYRIFIEEKALTSHFGDQYTEYKGKVKSLIPWII